MLKFGCLEMFGYKEHEHRECKGGITGMLQIKLALKKQSFILITIDILF